MATLIGAPVVRVLPDASLQGIADLLAAGEIGALLVGDENGVSGVVSERDVVHAIAQRKDLVSTRAMDVASTALVSCDPSASIAEVASQMMEHYVRHVLIEEEARVVGIVSARDLLGAYVAAEAG